MPDKPSTAGEYSPELLRSVRQTCLYVATVLGDFMEDLVVIGGLVPSLLIDQAALPEGTEVHAGTMDLDLGLSLAVLDEGQYQAIAARLRQAGFVQDFNQQGNPTRQRWKIEAAAKVTVDFLIQPSRPDDRGGKLRHLDKDFAAVIAPGLHLAFLDRSQVRISGHTIRGEEASREISVCGPGAFVVLKALAFGIRGMNKDAYDLFYVVRNFGDGVVDVATRLRPLLQDEDTQKALQIVRDDFLAHDGIGPRRVADFLFSRPDETIQADVVGFMGQLLREL